MSLCVRAATVAGLLCAAAQNGCSLQSLDELQQGVAERDAGASVGQDAAGSAPLDASWAQVSSGNDAGADGTAADSGTPPCAPETCSALGVACGSHADGCGETLDCGNCGSNEQCTNGQCECVPKTCSDLGWTCGVGSDGCGGQLSCGGCIGNTTCVSHSCQLAAGDICGSCPTGFDPKHVLYNDECGWASWCGESGQIVCVRDGISSAKTCGTVCQSGWHAALSAPHCTCSSGMATVCVPD